jgi:hypothetical protein
MKIKVIKHEVVPDCGSYEVRFPDGRPSKYFYFENVPGRRLQPGRVVEQTVAEQEAKRFARKEQDKLDSQERPASGVPTCGRTRAGRCSLSDTRTRPDH